MYVFEEMNGKIFSSDRDVIGFRYKSWLVIIFN